MTKVKKPINVIDPSKLRIVDEPYKDGRASPGSKYEPIFSKVKPNQRIVCPEGTASRLSAQYKDWLKKKGHKDPIVRARDRCDDGMGGVWWIQEVRTPKKPHTVWAGIGDIGRKAA